LQTSGLSVHLVTKILSKRAADPNGFRLAALDRHPNARAYDGIAAWVVAMLLPAVPGSARAP
jgi:hypothetical protein